MPKSRILHHVYRLVVKWARTLHVYLTLFGFGLLLFFAVTGFMLNHEDWFLQQKRQGTLPVELLASTEESKENEAGIVKALREKFELEGEVETFNYVKDDNEFRVVFKTAEARSSAAIKRVDGSTSVATEHERTTTGKMPMELLQPWDDKNKVFIVEKLREDFQVRGKMVGDVNREPESKSIRVIFKAPSYLATAVIEGDGQTTVTHQSRGAVGVFLDLHRGKDSGDEWSLVIDGVSILFVIVSITGLILWTSLRARAQYGFIVIIVGLAVSVVVYYTCVPQP